MLPGCTCAYHYVPAAQPGPDGVYDTEFTRYTTYDCPRHREGDREAIADLWPKDCSLSPEDILTLMKNSVAGAQELKEQLSRVFGPRTRLRASTAKN